MTSRSEDYVSFNTILGVILLEPWQTEMSGLDFT
jgi:hypothetical protein